MTRRPADGFVWQAPTRVRFGSGVVTEVGQETAALGSAPALLVDSGLCARQVLRDVRGLLTMHDVTPVVVRGVPANPDLAEIDRLLDAVLASGADVVVALGGGSTMDSAKTVALAATNPGLRDPDGWSEAPLVDLDLAESTGRRDRDLRPGLPTLLLPTTVATGSEVNTVAAVRHGGRRRLLVSGHLAPATALVDPDLSATLSLEALLEGAIETFARIISPYLVPADTLQTTDALAETLAAQCLAIADRLHSAGRGREELAWVTTVSGTQLVAVGRHRFGHALWHLQDPVCTLLDVPKGRAMAALLPSYLRSIASGQVIGPALGSTRRLVRLSGCLASVLGRSSDEPVASGDPGVWLAGRLETKLASWGLPTGLHQIGATYDDADRLAAHAYHGRPPSSPLAVVSQPRLAEYYRTSIDRVAQNPVTHHIGVGVHRSPAPTPSGRR